MSEQIPNEEIKEENKEVNQEVESQVQIQDENIEEHKEGIQGEIQEEESQVQVQEENKEEGSQVQVQEQNQEGNKEEESKEQEKKEEEEKKEGVQPQGDVIQEENPNEAQEPGQEEIKQNEGEEQKQENNENPVQEGGENAENVENGENVAENLENQNQENLEFVGDGESENSQSGSLLGKNEENATNVKSSMSSVHPTDFQTRFSNVLLLYKNKLSLLKNLPQLELVYNNFWNLLPHTFEDELTKASFVKLFSKIYKVILPIFNYPQIEKFVEGQWLFFAKEKETMNKKSFFQSLFILAHLWCTHINKSEYEDFLTMIYKRITKKIKIKQDSTQEFKPLIKVHLIDYLSSKEYDSFTWDIMKRDDDPTHKNLYESSEEPKREQHGEQGELQEEKKEEGEPIEQEQGGEGAEQNGEQGAVTPVESERRGEGICKERPKLLTGDKSLYDSDNNIFIYDEELFYPNQEEIEKLELNEYIKDELMEDDELIIFGYPTQFVINKFINEIKVLEDLAISEDSQYDSEFFITDYSPYEKEKIYLKIENKEKLLKFLKESTKITLSRDTLFINSSFSLGEDFTQDECNIHNNLLRNPVLDRYIEMYDIKLQNGQTVKANLNNLIMNNTYKKAFGNILKDKKSIGIKSVLWGQKIEEKIEEIVNHKFRLINIKLFNLTLNYASFEQVIDVMKDDVKNKKCSTIAQIKDDYAFFKKFESKVGIKFDNWDSDNDLYDEANKKSPVVLIVGPPLIGKTSVAEKLSKDLEMVLLEPKKFFESIFAKVAEFEEKMQNWDENEGAEENNEAANEGGEGGEEKKEEKKKKVKPGVDTVLNKVEFDIYNDIVNGPGISELNMQRMYQYLLHSDMAYSRGVVIDMNSNIYPKTDDPNNDDDCFVAKIFKGYFGEVTVDYVVDLNMKKEELIERQKSMKFNMKNLKYISPREIELMKKPKVPKKEVLEDEIEYDEEGKEVVPEPEPEPELGEEELEKIPKPEELLEITNFDKIFEDQYQYYEQVQYPKIMEYVSTLKSSYYINVDVTGLDFDEVSDLIKAQLDFANPLRPIAKVLEGGDHKSLLMDGREGILPFRRWSPWKQIDPVALKDDFLILTGSTEFAASYFSRVFLFVSDENRKKFLENPKKYINSPPQVPINYRISIIGPPKSGKSTIASILSELYGWKIMDMEEIYEKVKEYQKSWEEPELNSVYTRRVHFSAQEFKDLMANLAKKPSDRKPDNFVSKIVFMLDALGIPLDKRKTKEQFFEERKYHSDKLAHMFTRMREAKEREEQAKEDERIRIEEEEAEKKRLEEEAKQEEELFVEMTECARAQYDIEKAKRAKVYEDHVQAKIEEKEKQEKELELKEAQNPFPAEEEYVIEDLRSDQFYFAFDNDGNQKRVSGIILMNHPFSEDEYEKLKDYQILMDRVIYLNDSSDEGIKALISRRNPNLKFDALDEEKQGAEMEKIKAEQGKFEEVIGILKEKYSTNNEDCVVEVGYNEPIESLRLKLINALNPFSIRVDSEDKVIMPADVPAEEKFPLSKGPFGLFCPVVYKEDNWLFYSPEANEVQVNQRVYRLSGEKEMEKFKENPALYLGENGSLTPIDVPPPHIMITGYQGSGITFFSNILCKEFKLVKREIQKEFMEIWEKQKAARKEIRVNKKKEELQKQNEEIEQKNKENAEGEPEPLVDINEAIANDAALDEEDENYNAVDNDKEIFKSLFHPLEPTIYDASWNNMEEKVSTPFLDLLTETRRVPNVMVIFKVNMKSIMDRHFHLDKIEAEYEKMLKVSNDKRKQREADLIKQKQQEQWEKLKEEIENEQQNEENAEGEGENPEGEKEENAEGEEEEKKDENAEEEKEGENPEGEEEGKKKKKKKKRKLPEVSEIKVELEQEEKDDIWNSPDPDLIEKDALIQQEKDKLSQRFEANTNAIQTMIETLKEKGIPVIEITNDTTKENVYKNLLVELKPYIKNRRNLIEKQLVNDKKFENPLLLRKVRDLYNNSEVYLQSVYNKLSPVNPSKHCIRTDYPLVYRDRVYLFNKEEEKKEFDEYPLEYRTGLECPKDSYPMRGRTIIFTIGQTCSGKTTLSKLVSDYMGYKRVSVRRAFLDLIEKLHDCQFKKQIEEVLFKGGSTDDDLIIKVLKRRITMADLINENLIIDGFPYTLTQANLIPPELNPDFVFVSQCDTKTNIQRAMSRKGFKGIPNIVAERMKELGYHLQEILQSFNEKKYDLRYFDMTKSKWYLKGLLHELLEERKKSEMCFARNLSLNKPCLLNNMAPLKLRESILVENYSKAHLYTYSPVALKTSGQFRFNKYKNNSIRNKIMYTPLSEHNKFHFLTNDEEVKQFMENPDYYINFIENVHFDTIPPRILKSENLSTILYKDYETVKNVDEEGVEEEKENQSNVQSAEELSFNVKYEYEECCPVTLVEDNLMKKGMTVYSVQYQGKYFKFLSVEKMKKFVTNPSKYMNLRNLKVRKINVEENMLSEKQIRFENTVNFLEFTFGSLITKGMFELSKNKIKYPYLNVKESSLKYLALFLKANNPNNNEYERKKYNEILKDFIKNSKLPFELLRVYDNYMKEKDNPLHKMLIRKQLDNVADKYDELMEKAKIQNNTRFENFFRRQFDDKNS